MPIPQTALLHVCLAQATCLQLALVPCLGNRIDVTHNLPGASPVTVWNLIGADTEMACASMLRTFTFVLKCKDLDYLESQRYSFLNLSQHLTSILLLPILLPFLSDYLYPLSLRHKHTRTQRLRTLQLFLQGLSAWKTTSTTYLI